MVQLIKTYFRILSALAPNLAGRQAFQFFQRPLNKKIRPKEQSFFNAVKHFKIKHYKEDIQCYELGPNNGELVILVHGWESNAASLSGIGLQLAEKGYHVILFNLPAHGHSQLKKSNIKLCKDALLAVLAHIKPQEPFSIVSHSFGSAVSAYALSKTSYRVRNLVFLTTPNKITKVFRDFGQFIGLKSGSQKKLEQMAEDILKEPLSNISVELLGKKINYDQLTVIHDEKDKIISIKDAQTVQQAWASSRLVIVQNKGHYRMLWDQEVLDHVTNALNSEKSDPNIEALEAVLY